MMIRACSTNWSDEEYIYDIGGKARRKETTRTTTTWVDGWIILKLILERWVGTDWTDLALDRNQWRALVNLVRNLQFQ
jgi:hypothetical protein